MPRRAPRRSVVPAALLLIAWSAGGSPRAEAADAPSPKGSAAAPALTVPEGFRATLHADDDLAHDIYSMTVDSLGRIVVSGPGYVRILLDENGDGRADSFRQFADGPRSGAQGMCFHGRDLLCTGDAGMIRYRDADGDDRADGPPDVFLKIATGAEHTAHAIRRGPDGWWHLLAGNASGVTASYATLASSPIKKPHAGVLLRLRPELDGGEIVADGFRNPYDFDFGPSGDAFTYDSDGERDVTLPWYRPTRVFHVLPGSNAGWVTQSWKRPDEHPGMPPTVASTGRGSPTGVVCYRHRRFPEKYRGALFVLDWTFGRVFALPMRPGGSTWTSEPEMFVTGRNQFGFAPTDAVVGADGSLYVSVGGRGTRGGVYRIEWVAKPQAATELEPNRAPVDAKDALANCLDADDPLSSWSRARWTPIAQKLGRAPFLEAALDERLPVAHRVRAIEIVTELFGGIQSGELRRLAGLDSKAPAEVCARAVWSLGCAAANPRDGAAALAFLDDSDPRVQRAALEAADRQAVAPDDPETLVRLARCLGAPDRGVRLAAARLVPRCDPQRLEAATRTTGAQALVTLGCGLVDRGSAGDVSPRAIGLGLEVLEADHPPGVKREAVQLLQLAIGGCGPREGLPPAFHGYASAADLEPHERDLDPLRIAAANLYSLGDAEVDRELARLLAMLAPANPRVLDRLLAQITDESGPIDDIHHLLCAARIAVPRNRKQQEAIARALVRLDAKIVAKDLNRDLHWNDRIGELYARLAEIDPVLPQAIVAQPGFGRPRHVLYLAELPEEALPAALAAFARQIAADAEYPWSSDVVFALGASSEPAHRRLVRERYHDFAVQSAVSIVLAARPDAEDRPKFVEGLGSSRPEVLAACLDALEKLSAIDDAREQVALLRALRRLGTVPEEYPLRERVAKLLRRNTGQDVGFVLGEAGHRPQPEAIARWTDWIEQRHPEEARTAFGGSAEGERIRNILPQVDWSAGDPARGGKLFMSRACAQCHGSGSALGPDLAGVARRFSREDLFTAIADPGRDVSPRYQTTLIQTTQGRVYSGLVVYDAVDGLILRNATNQTFRIEGKDIEFRRTLDASLMPDGLLKDLGPEDLADLDAYLRSR
ncbi:MAG: PVC-type heme-binding CxxCH protein [Planctomycetales bacterium]